jgi:hypothetical protein
MRSRRVVGLTITHLLGAALAAGLVLAVVLRRDEPLAILPECVLLAATLATGWLLAARLPRNPLGWVLLWVTATFVAQPIATSLGALVRNDDRPAAVWLTWYAGDSELSWSWVPPVWALLIWIPLLFPDGRLPSRRWRPFAALTVAEFLLALIAFACAARTFGGLPNPTYVPAVSGIADRLLAVSGVLAAASFIGTVVSLVVRYRRGGPVVRAQVRWMALGVAIAAAMLMIGWLPGVGSYTDWIIAGYALIPIAVAVAVLKYRLFEIDRIISRTAAYAVVTVVVLGTYLGVVLLVSVLVPHPGKATPAIAVALATLAAAAVFFPVLRRVRRWVDRLFNRPQYDAERVVAAFGERVRNGADPQTAGTELVHAVEVTLDPVSLGLWVRS